MSKFIKIISFIVTVVMVFCITGCKKREEPKPILKVITSEQIGVTIFSYKKYFIVYNNGKIKRISEFEPTEVEYYLFGSTNYEDEDKLLHDIDLNTEKGKELNTIAEKIKSLADTEDDFFSPGALYIIEEKYYFTISVKKKNGSTANALCVYNEKDNSINEIASFKSGITHIEPYKS